MTTKYCNLNIVFVYKRRNVPVRPSLIIFKKSRAMLMTALLLLQIQLKKALNLYLLTLPKTSQYLG